MDKLNRKGVMFTLLSILVAGFFVIFFSADTSVPLDHGVDTVSFRVDVMHRYVEAFEDFASDSLKTASYNSLGRISEYINYQSDEDIFSDYDEFEDNFKECLLNGTLRDGAVNCSGTNEPFNQTIKNWLDEMKSLTGSNMSFETNYSIGGISLGQSLPFVVRVEMNLTYSVVDVFASVSRNVTIVAEVPIQGLKEPLAASQLGTSQVRYIKETDIKNSEWNKANLTYFVNEQEYRYEPTAPSILKRYVEDYSASSCCGIEAIFSSDVDGIATGAEEPFLENVSYVDYQYLKAWDFASHNFSCGDNAWAITGLDGVQMDDYHLASYNVSTDDWNTDCD